MADAERLAGGQRFRPDDRLHHKRDFDRIHSAGIRLPGRHFTLIATPSALERSRLGVALGRKVGNAVVRNRARRRLREVFRRQRGMLPGSFDVVVVGRPGIGSAPATSLEQEFLERCARLTRLMKDRT